MEREQNTKLVEEHSIYFPANFPASSITLQCWFRTNSRTSRLSNPVSQHDCCSACSTAFPRARRASWMYGQGLITSRSIKRTLKQFAPQAATSPDPANCHT